MNDHDDDTPAYWDEYGLPYPYFGGKSRVAQEVWARFRGVTNYIEPFCGGCSVLLAREAPAGDETVNDLHGFIPNFWRSVRAAPDEVAYWCDYPVSEVDLHARHRWLVDRGKRLPDELRADPHFYDVKVAGWWVWGQSAWLGKLWCSDIRADYKIKPTHSRMGVHRKELPDLDALKTYFRLLCRRMRNVRILCGDWRRTITGSELGKNTGVFLDPPYIGKSDLYARHCRKVAKESYVWAVAHGDDIELSIAYCCESGQFPCPNGWSCYEWDGPSIFGSQPRKEHIFFSPFCQPHKGRTGYV